MKIKFKCYKCNKDNVFEPESGYPNKIFRRSNVMTTHIGSGIILGSHFLEEGSNITKFKGKRIAVDCKFCGEKNMVFI